MGRAARFPDYLPWKSTETCDSVETALVPWRCRRGLVVQPRKLQMTEFGTELLLVMLRKRKNSGRVFVRLQVRRLCLFGLCRFLLDRQFLTPVCQPYHRNIRKAFWADLRQHSRPLNFTPAESATCRNLQGQISKQARNHGVLTPCPAMQYKPRPDFIA